jgi:hypothetical protein
LYESGKFQSRRPSKASDRDPRDVPGKIRKALEVLTRYLQSDDDRIAMMAAQAILDRAYGKPT